MNGDWRKWIWNIAIIASLSILFIIIIVIYSVNEDYLSKTFLGLLLLRLITPVCSSLLTAGVLAVIYERILKPHDEFAQKSLIDNSVKSSIDNLSLSTVVEDSVKAATAHLDDIVGDSVYSAVYGHNYQIDRNTAGDLSVNQVSAKAKLIALAEQDYRERLLQFSRHNILRIPEFKNAWDVLIRNTFLNNEDLLDFSIGSNAMFKVQAYQFTLYYSSLIEERGRHVSSRNSKIRIMILCDDVSWQYGKDHDMTDVASKELELAVKRILEKAGGGMTTPPNIICGRLGRETGHMYQFRLINKNHFREHPHDVDAFSTPFNVYGKTALSRSFIAPSRTESSSPLPHLQVSLNAPEIAAQRESFFRLWNTAAKTVDAFSATMINWNLFGEGKLLAQWARVEIA